MPPSSRDSILHHLQHFLHQRHVTGPILLAVSGGPDSVCLLHAMTQLVDKSTLHIAHFNHHLRGDASDADAGYVESLCRQYALYFHLGQSDQLRPKQTGIENRARQLRYQWLTDIAQQSACRGIMTGHTMNDQAETVLHHLIRGTGWRGLRGIAPQRLLPSPPRGEGLGVRGSQIVLNPIEKPQTHEHELTPSRSPSPLTPLPPGERGTRRENGTRLLRPLLRCTRQDILDYLELNHLTPRHDASNDDVRFTRNRIRHQMMPNLMTMNQHVVKHLASWAGVARRHYAQLQQSARALLPGVILYQSPHQLALKQEGLFYVSDEILQELLRRLWRKQHWPVDQMNTQRWLEVMEVCRGKRTGVELPGRIMVKIKHKVVQITKPKS